MKLSKYLFNTVNNKEHGQPCLHHLHVFSPVFSWWPFFSLSFGSFFHPHPSCFILPLLNQCDRCLVLLAWGLMAGERGFASHGVVTLSRGWLCQRWEPLDIPGTHLHQATHWLMPNMTTNHAITYTYTLSVSCLNLAEVSFSHILVGSFSYNCLTIILWYAFWSFQILFLSEDQILQVSKKVSFTACNSASCS